LQSDNGTEFVNDLSRDLCTKLVSLNDWLLLPILKEMLLQKGMLDWAKPSR
jgi:hypothetical protein